MRIALLTLGDPGRLTGGYLFHRRMAERAADHDAELNFLSLPDGPFPLPALRGRAVVRAATGGDAVVLDSIAAALVAPWLSSARGMPPMVAMLHQPPGGIDHGPVRSRVLAVFDRRAYRSARLLMVASESLRDDMLAAGWPETVLRLVPPGSDTPPPAGDAGDLREGREAAFLAAGNWVPRKGILDLLEAFSRLPAGAGTLHLAGDDHVDPRYAARVRSRLARADLAGRVVVHGPLDRPTLSALYDAADVFVLSSTREPYGTVYGEALAAGLPVVGWRAGNLPYLARDGEEGLMAPVGDIDALSTALHRLATDHGLRSRLAAAAAVRGAALPTWDRTAALFFGTIREALAVRIP